MAFTTPAKESKILWQSSAEDNVPEQALLIEFYTSEFSITQGDNCIIINYETVQELLKIIKSHKK